MLCFYVLISVLYELFLSKTMKVHLVYVTWHNYVFFFEAETHVPRLAWDVFEIILLPPYPACWGYGSVLPSLPTVILKKDFIFCY